MHLLWKRYTRSGFAPPWFYTAMSAAFLALAVWGGLRADWTVMALALALAPATLAGARLMRRLSAAAEASRREIERRRQEEDDG